MSNRLTAEQLDKLTAPRLLKLYRARTKELGQSGVDYLHMTERPEVQEYLELEGYCNRIKAILDTREHIPK